MSRRSKGDGSIRVRKDGRWEARLTLPGGKRRSFSGRTKDEALRKLRAGRRKIEDNLPIPSERETLSSYLDTWLREVAEPRVRPRTLDSYRMIVEKHLKPALGSIALARLTPDAVQSYMNAKRNSGLSARTVAYHHGVLRTALTQAERWGKVSRNVAKLTSPPRGERAEITPLTPAQARTLLEAIANSRDAALFGLAIGIGLRQGELLGMQWNDVDLEQGTLTVRHTLQRYGRRYHLDAPKTNKSRRTLALPQSLIQLLRAHRAIQLEERLSAGPAWDGGDWNLVFCSERGLPLPGNWLTHRFQALLDSLGLPRQRFHDLRHAAATYMVAQGVDLRVIMEVLGHSQIHVTANTYAHVKLDLTREAAERVDALLSGP